MVRARLLGLAAMLACAVLTSCSQGTSASDGDCTSRFRLHGDIYRPAVGLQIPHRGVRIGTAPSVDCEGRAAPQLGDVELFAIPGQEPSQLVIVAEENGDAVYMDDTIPWRERPRLVKDSQQYLTCSGPTRFTGTWRYIDPEDVPNGEDYDSAHIPYTVNFTTREGSGVQLDQWAQVTLQAEITGGTKPVPSAGFLERAMSRNVPVAVTASCHAQSFQVETIRFAS
jgi:hypothetical protein